MGSLLEERHSHVRVSPAVVYPLHVVKEIENMVCEEGLKEMALFSQRCESIVSFFDCLMGGYRKVRAGLFQKAHNESTKCNRQKVGRGKFG